MSMDTLNRINAARTHEPMEDFAAQELLGRETDQLELPKLTQKAVDFIKNKIINGEVESMYVGDTPGSDAYQRLMFRVEWGDIEPELYRTDVIEAAADTFRQRGWVVEVDANPSNVVDNEYHFFSLAAPENWRKVMIDS